MPRHPSMWILGLVSISLSACSGLGDGGGGGSGGGGDVSPPSGVWRYMDGGVTESTCGDGDLIRDEDTSFRLTNNGDGTFTIDQQDQDFDCSITGSAFECPDRLTGTDMPVENVDATLSWHVSVRGTFEDEDSMSGTQLVNVTCEGAACALAPDVLGVSFPCAYEVAFTAEGP